MLTEKNILFILYVKDQTRSKSFYLSLFAANPTLDVPGMTEIPLTDTTSIGLMPGDGIVQILEGKIENPNQNITIPRCEVYVFVDDPDKYYLKAIELGGTGISEGAIQNWGDYVSYCSDFDGNIIAFAKREIKK